MTRLIRFTVAVVVLCLLWLAMPQHSTVAQAACPAEVGCAQLSLTPNTLLGDFFLGDQLLAAGQNAPLLQIPPGQNLQIVVRNIQSPGDANFNNLYVYQESTVRVNVAAGKVKPYKATPRKQFIRGTLNFTCDPRGVVAGEDVSCQVIIDGADRGVHPLKTVVPFILDPGPHTVAVQLVGGSVGLWEPNRKEQASRITAGRNTPLRVQFDKRARLIVKLSQPGTVGDIFVNDVLIAGQSASIDIYVPANVTQNIVVRNINPPQPGSRWLESTGSARLPSSSTRTVTIRLKKQSLGGGNTSAALNSMQRALDQGRAAWQEIADFVWTPVTNGFDVPCFYRFRKATLPNVSQSLLDSNPAYKEAYDILANAINSTNAAIQAYYDACATRGDRRNLYFVGITSKDNAENFFNQAQDKLNALRNSGQ